MGHHPRALDHGVLDRAHAPHLDVGRVPRPAAAIAHHARGRARARRARRRVRGRCVAQREPARVLRRPREVARADDGLLPRPHRRRVRRRGAAQADRRHARRRDPPGAAPAHAAGGARRRPARVSRDAAAAALPVQLSRCGARAGARVAGHRGADDPPARRAAPIRRPWPRADGDARARSWRRSSRTSRSSGCASPTGSRSRATRPPRRCA